jgi:hypothetical protein
MRTHDPLRRLLMMGALIVSLLTAIALILAEAVHHRGPGAPPQTRLEKG